MQNLLKCGHVTKEERGLQVKLYLISGEARPEIDKINEYRWRLSVNGNNKYHHIKELRVDFSFVNHLDTTHMEISDYIPRKGIEEIAIVTASPVPQIISVSVPINRDKIITEQSPSKIGWIFKDIDLSKSENTTETFEGVVTARFYPESIDKRIAVVMNVVPDFCEKDILRRMKRCPSSPRIEDREVKESCIEIIPGDPERGSAGIARPDNERTLKYRYIIDQGILEKGLEEKAVRNVSLRAETLAIFFDALKNGLLWDSYYKLAKDAGKQVGKNFVKELERILGHKPTIKEWFEYDATAGMGRFEMNDEKNAIIVKNSFTAYKTKSKIPVCCFLEGYFEGILSEIFRKPTIIVTETNCIAKGDEECIFIIE